MTIAEMLATARARLRRLDPDEAHAAVAGGALLIDIRSERQRHLRGAIPGARYHPRNVLEWRLDPTSSDRDPAVGGLDRQVIVVCHEGYQSSLAAAALQDLGFTRATDLVGGFEAWRAAGLPVEPVTGEA